MKTFLLLFLVSSSLAIRAWGHGGAPLGPHGGRLLEFSKDHRLLGELTLTNGVFRVALMDEKLKPITLGEQILQVTGGERNNPVKPTVTRENNFFVFPALKGEEYLLVLQFRENPDARAVTARMTYNASPCSACKHPEWLCQCGEDEDDQKDKPVAK